MRFTEMCEALEQVRHWHLEIAKRFGDAATEANTGPRARLLFDYMGSRHELFAHGVEEFMTECPAVERDSWAKHPEHGEKLDDVLRRMERSSVGLEEAEDLGVAVNAFFIDLFDQLARGSDSRQVREVFESLKAGAKKEQTKLSRNVNLMQDF